MLCVKPDLHSKPVHTANTTTMTGKATSQMNSMMGFRWDGVAFTMRRINSGRSRRWWRKENAKKMNTILYLWVRPRNNHSSNTFVSYFLPKMSVHCRAVNQVGTITGLDYWTEYP